MAAATLSTTSRPSGRRSASPGLNRTLSLTMVTTSPRGSSRNRTVSPRPSWSRLRWISCCAPWSTERCRRAPAARAWASASAAWAAWAEVTAWVPWRPESKTPPPPWRGPAPPERAPAAAGPPNPPATPSFRRRNLAKSTWEMEYSTMKSTISRVIMSA